MDMFDVYPFNIALDVFEGNKQLVLGVHPKYFLKSIHRLSGDEKLVVFEFYKEGKTIADIERETQVKDAESTRVKAIELLRGEAEKYKAVPITLASGNRKESKEPVIDEAYIKAKEAYSKVLIELEALITKEIEERGVNLNSEGLIEIVPELFSTRAYNGLTRNGYKTVNELEKLTVSDIVGIRGLGVGTVREIIRVAESYGITIKDI